MDVFPEKCFPCRYQKDSLKMRYFGGLGSNKNIDVADSNVQDRNFSSQHVPFESEWYCASGPALPLSSSPARVTYPFEDRVAKEFKTQRNDAEIFCNRLKTMRAGLKKSRNTTMQKSFKDVLEQLESMKQPKDCNSKEISVPTWIEDLVKQYEKVNDIQKVKNYNSKYTGGCLSRLGIEATDGTQLLISPADHNFNTLALLELNTSQVSITQKTNVELGYELFQLLSKQCRNVDYSVTRGEEICEVFTYQENSEGCSCVINSVGKEAFPGESLTSVDLSVYIPTECVMATNEGNFYLWTPGQSKSLVRELQETRFPSHESWRQVMFGSHPRHIVIADPTAVQLTDIRGHSSASVDLFALPNKLFDPAERLCLVEKHPSSHHAYLIASNKNLLLMDDRFPGCPMLQWNHMLRKPPQVASSIVLETDRVMVAMGSLTPAEVFAYQYRYGLSNMPQSLGSPWRFSHFGDFTDLLEMCNPLHKFAADQRFESSLTGISLLNTQSGFSLIQLDSQGELYYQEFEKSSETREVRFCGGPGCGEVSVDRLTVERGKKWTRDLHDYINTCKNSTHIVNVTDVFSEITLKGPGHVSCPLCMPDTCDLQLNIPTAGLCYSCGHLISDAKTIAETKYNNIVQSVGMMESDQEKTNSIDQTSLCPLGEILLHQWNEDSDDEDEETEEKFMELLRKRNENIKERRKNLKKTVSVSLQQEVSTTVECQISSPMVVPNDEELVPDCRELQDVIARYTGGNGLSGQRQMETPVPVAGDQDSCDERDYKQVEEADGQSLSNQQRTDMRNVDESEFSGVFVSQVERDYPFMKQSPRKRKKTSYGSDQVSNFSSISQWSNGFLATPPRLLSQHSTVKDSVQGSADKTEKDTHDGSEVRKFGMMYSSPQLPILSYGRTRHHSLSNSVSRQSVKSNISVQSDGFRSTPNRLHILNSPAKRSRVASPDLGSAQSSVSDLNSSIDLFDPNLKAFDLLKTDLPMEGPKSQPTNSQTDSQGRKKVKKQLMTGF